MVSAILSAVSHFIINTISSFGYGGTAILMAIGAFNIPLPSEVIMPFSGFLVSTGRFSLWGVALAATFGWTAGAIASYYLGVYGGRPVFGKYGVAMVFVGQLLPVIRNFISIVSGITRVKLGRFLIFTAIGAFLWSLLLAYIGMKLGENWESLKGYFHRFDTVIGILIILGIIWWIYRHIKHSRSY